MGSALFFSCRHTMLRKTFQFARLSLQEKLLFIEAYFTLGMMRAAILLFSFKQVTKGLIHHNDKKEVSIKAYGGTKLTRKIGKAIRTAANNTPWESACLAQSLCAYKMLQRRNIPGIFYLGVMKSTTNNQTVQAHAWSEADGEILTGKKGHTQYSVISIYQWNIR